MQLWPMIEIVIVATICAGALWLFVREMRRGISEGRCAHCSLARRCGPIRKIGMKPAPGPPGSRQETPGSGRP